jgi:transmembrane sensor
MRRVIVNEEIVRVLQGKASQAEVAEVEEWRDSHPENARRFQEMAALWNMMGWHDEIRSGGAVPTAEGLLGIPDHPVTVAGGSGSRPFSRNWAMGLAASVVLLAGIGYATLVRSPAERPSIEFRAPAHEGLTAALTDGSVVRLSPGSTLSVMDSEDARTAVLVGTAFFSVAHQEDRPFVVMAGEGTAQVVGTRFSLELDGASLRLTVLDGLVRLGMGRETGLVGSGQRGEVSPGEGVRIQQVPDIFSDLGWMGDFLAFEATTLGRVTEELEARFGISVRVTDPGLLDRTITAWLEESEVDSILDVVCRVASVSCERSGGLVRMSP